MLATSLPPAPSRPVGHLALNLRGAALPLLCHRSCCSGACGLRGFRSYRLPRLEVFGKICRQNSSFGIQRLPFRSARLRLQKTGGAPPAAHTLKVSLATLPSRSTGGRGAAALCYRRHSAAPGAGPSGLASRASWSRGSEAHLQRPDNRRGRGLSFAGPRRCRPPGPPGATSRPKSGFFLSVVELRSGRGK